MHDLGISDGQLVLRLVVAAILCGFIGIERESRERVAGLRTHILVGLGAALFTLVSAYGFEAFLSGGHVPNNVGFDPTRVAAQIVTGVGFLGAGAIIRAGFNVRGLTTAASLWATAAVGMAVGAGYYLGAVIVTGLVLISLAGLRKLRPKFRAIFRADRGEITVTLSKSEGKISDVVEVFDRNEMTIDEMDVAVEEGVISCRVYVQVPPHQILQSVLGQIDELPGARSASVSGLRAE